MKGPKEATPQQFGKYTLVAKLAIGGMAEILLARLEGAAGFAKLVCIKRMLPALARDRRLVEMFLTEAKIAAQITHHNVCQTFELGEIDGRYYIAMEYLAGIPLSCFRRKDLYATAPDPQLAIGLAVQACEGLHHAHNLKRPDGSVMEVVHRDVTANNLFVTTDGVVKVLDFGIAKVQDTHNTRTNSIKGTSAYMAPEQARRDPLDRRADVFALGVVLWETLARRHLFKRDTDYATLMAVMQDPIPNVCEHRPDVPEALGEVIAKALARDRNDRIQSARAFADALSKAVAPLGGPATPIVIAEEIARAFEARLHEQRSLIQMAHEGRALDLDADVGPGIGHGTKLITTPASIVTDTMKVLGPDSDSVEDKTSVRVRPQSAVIADAPPRSSPSRWFAIAVVALLVAVAIVVLLFAF
ncbi:MAG: serine/threonine protein kinase [Deltaproteobacteria bacterium]|nr:serine/threonine protein kinase [Deltaproteobacteria bacterium]